MLWTILRCQPASEPTDSAVPAPARRRRGRAPCGPPAAGALPGGRAPPRSEPRSVGRGDWLCAAAVGAQPPLRRAAVRASRDARLRWAASLGEGRL